MRDVEDEDLLTGQLTLINIALIRTISLVGGRLSIAISWSPITGLHSSWHFGFGDLGVFAPARKLPASAASEAAWVENRHGGEGKNHDCGLEDHECDLVVGELAGETVSEFRDTIGRTNEDQEAGDSEC